MGIPHLDDSAEDTLGLRLLWSGPVMTMSMVLGFLMPVVMMTRFVMINSTSGRDMAMTLITLTAAITVVVKWVERRWW